MISLKRLRDMQKILVLLHSLLIIFFNCSSSNSIKFISRSGNYPIMPDEPVKNIIFYIGDGMGMSQICASRIKTFGAYGKLEIEKMPISGFINTHSIDQLITDSAAGATAMASGFKTKNGMIGVTPDSTPVRTILEAARDMGKSTGLVATSTITHATPACFAAHCPSRKDQSTIAEHLIKSKVNVILGGGKQFFIPDSVKGSLRPDDKNLIEQAQKDGYLVMENYNELPKAEDEYLLGLFENGPLKRGTSEPGLLEMTEKSIQLLNRNKAGFFLVVEGSQIDWGGHDNDIDYVVEEQLEFDKALKAGLEFAANDKHTLVVVTADHETGGLHCKQGPVDGKQMGVVWSTGGHTGEPVPIFAFGPFAHRFTGVMDNTEVPKIFAALWGITNFPQKPN
jgi:alkaline phosphatase